MAYDIMQGGIVLENFYIRLDDNGSIIGVLTDTSDALRSGDLRIPDFLNRHMELFGEENPSLFTDDNRPIYRYVDGEVKKWDTLPPPVPGSLDAMTRLQLVMAEMIELGIHSNGRELHLSVQESVTEREIISTYAISDMYVDLIGKGLRTLENIPERLRADVEKQIAASI